MKFVSIKKCVACLFFVALLVLLNSEEKTLAGPFGRCGKEVPIYDGGKLEGYTCIYHFFHCGCDRRNYAT
jgi:hypothetical protein